ncbi:MAG: aminoacyl-tRNA hydrolase [Ruminococcus sp.]|nr:aminoacyl-tRNA hydrolase [Ruminococcus sp.]
MDNLAELFKKISGSSREPAGAVEYIIVGLGNVGTDYEGTRHNAGFMAIDRLARKYNTDIKKLKFKSLCGDVVISGKRCLLVKPSTFMNLSGQAVVEAMEFYKIPTENVIVLYDDISLPPSKLRVRRKGSDGGHNGIKNIIYLTGKNDFPRVKIGVGERPNPNIDLADWVLSRFKKEEYEALSEALDKSVTCVELIVDGKIDEAMNRFN